MYCNNCGTQIEMGVQFCRKCGCQIKSQQNIHMRRVASYGKLSVRVRIVFIALVMFSLCVTGISVYIHNDRLELKKQNEMLKSENSKLSEQIAQVTEEKGISDNSFLIAGGMALYFTDNFDKLHQILIDADSSSVDTINWFRDNAQFDNSILPLASSYYTAWRTKEDMLIDDYIKLTEDIEATLQKISDTSSDSNRPQTQGL